MKTIYENKNLKLIKDERLSNVIVWMMMGLLLTNASYLFGNQISSFIALISKLIIIILLLKCVNVIKLRISIEMFVLYAFFFVCFVGSFFLMKDDSGYFQILTEFILNVFPLTYVIFMLNDFDRLLLKLEQTSKLLIVLSIIFVCISNSNTTYYMGFANALVVPIITLIYGFFNKQKYSQLLFACCGIVIILFIGSRGALLPITVYFIIKLIKSFKKYNNKILNNKMNLLISTILIILVLFKELIVQSAYNVLNRIGIHSRTIYLFVNDINHTSGRDMIQDSIMKELSHHPFVVRGIGGDYTVTGGAYAHNIMLEILIQFGVVIGGMLLIALFILIIKTLCNTSKAPYSEFRLMMMCSSIPLLMVSGSFWRSFYFWIWIVMCVRKDHKINEKSKIT